MATDDSSSRERASVHRMLTLLNSSHRSIIAKLEHLSASEVLSPQYLEKLKKRSDEIEKELKSIFNF